MTGWFDGAIYQIEEVRFDSDGSVWDADTLEILAGGGADGVGEPDNPAESDAILLGNSGNDVITGDASANIFYGDIGDDTLIGDAGNDTYIFNVGGGVDTIYDSGAGGEVNTIVFGAGIDRGDVTLGLGSLLLRVGGGGDSIHIANFDPKDVHAQPSIAQFIFGNGEAITYEELISGGFDLDGTQGDDLMEGTNVIDRMSGLDGNDVFHSFAGADWLNGGAGNDYLAGGAGNDVYFFGEGGGSDVIDESDALNGDFDSIELLTTPGNVSVRRDGIGGVDLVFLMNRSGDSLTISNFDAPQNHIEEVRFSDGTIWDRAQLMVEVSASNSAPILDSDVPDQSALEDAPFSFTLPAEEFIDSDGGDTLVLSASKNDGAALPSWLAFDPVTRVFSGTPGNGDVGVIELKVVATDRSGATASDTFDLSVLNTNDTPVLANAIGNFQVLEDAEFSVALPADQFFDVDAGDSLSLEVVRMDGSTLPSWLSFDMATRTIRGTPENADVGSFSLKVIATDGAGATVRDTFSATVLNTNDSPFAVADNFALNENGASGNLSLAMLANDTDPDLGDVWHISAVDTTGTVGFVTFDVTTQSVVYSANGAAIEALGSGAMLTDGYVYTVVDAAGAASSAQVSLTIAGINDAPVLSLQTGAQSATVGNAFSVMLAATTFSDVDAGDTLIYGARLAGGAALPSWLTFNAATRTLSGVAAADNVGSYAIDVTATDSGNLSAVDSFTLSVSDTTAGLTLTGITGNDLLSGGAGNDVLDGQGGADHLSGNDGNDTLKYFADGTWSSGFVAYNAGSPGIAGTAKSAAIAGKNRSFEIFDGGRGEDVILGTAGDDAIFLDDGFSAFPGISGARIAGVERIDGGLGNDVIDLTSSIYGYGSVTLVGGAGNDVLWASAGDDLLFGDAGNDDLFGGAGQDYLLGGAGNDTLNGDRGDDLMEGSAGNDKLNDLFGNNLFYAKDGNDSLTGGDGGEIFIGGAGNDSIVTGGGADVIVFNRGDGHDTVAKSAALDNTLSLGGGILYSDLYLAKRGNNLVLQTAANEDLTFADWYTGNGNRSVKNLQMIMGGGSDFVPAGVDALRDNRVEQFDFSAIVNKFDQARASSPSTANRWAIMNALLDAHLGNGCDTEALGGDLAYRYGTNGSLAGIGVNSAQAILAGQSFGASPQGLQSFSGLQEGLVKLG